MIKAELYLPEVSEQKVNSRNPSSIIKPILPPVVGELPIDNRTKELVDAVLATVFERLAAQKERVATLSNVLIEYNKLPRQTVGEKRNAKKLVRETAAELLQNPQDINTAVFVWKRHESFYALVKEESKTLIREKWESITPEQLAELVRTYADNPQAQDFPREMLTSYFGRPKTRRQRINAYYTFVSSVANLVGEDKAFNEGVRIGLYDTDILPKDPYLIEQNIFTSLPYTIFLNSSNGAKDLLSLPRNKDEERDLQKSLIAEYAILKLSTMGSKDLEEARRRRNDFISTNTYLRDMWEQAQRQAEEKLGSSGLVRQLHNAMKAFTDSIDALSREHGNENSRIHDLFNNETNPLNQKFKEVLPQRAALKKTHSFTLTP